MIEKQSGRHLMSGFHGLFSLGGILGAGGVSLLILDGASPLLGAAGFGYAAFAAAMTLGRLTRDGIVRRFGGLRVLIVSGLVAAAGMAAVLPMILR